MTDNTHEDKSRGVSDILAATWDQIALLVGFGYLITITIEYPDSARQFPLVFLVAGFCFLLVQFVSELLPPVYANRVKALTQGIASEMDVEDAVEGAGTPEDQDQDKTEVEPILSSQRARFVGIISLLFVFVAIAYLIGFIYAIPLLVLGNVGLLGKRDWRTGVVATILVIVAIYLMFGQMLNVPVMEGVYEVPIPGGVL